MANPYVDLWNRGPNTSDGPRADEPGAEQHQDHDHGSPKVMISQNYNVRHAYF